MKRFVRWLTRWAWNEMLWDVARVEWKFGRHDDGTPRDWCEWDSVREHLREHGAQRAPWEIE